MKNRRTDFRGEEALANIREAIQLYLEPVEDDLAVRETTQHAELVEIVV